MPNNILFNDTMFPAVSEGESWRSAVKKILNYEYMLQEQLRYTMFNLSGENFNTAALGEITEPLYAAIRDRSGELETKIELTAEGILSTVSRTYATQQALGTVSSQISQQADKIALVVGQTSAGGDYIKAAQIMAAINDDESGVQISGDRVDISASDVYISGHTTFSDWLDTSGGETTIDGSHITAGTIKVDELYVMDRYRDETRLYFNGSSMIQSYNGQTQFCLARGSSSIGTALGITLGITTPIYLAKIFSNGRDILWLGDASVSAGLWIDLDDKTYEFRGLSSA